MSAIWAIGVLAGLGLFVRGLQFTSVLLSDGYWESLVWIAPATIGAIWLAAAIRWFRDTGTLVPLQDIVLSALPLLPVAVMGFLLHPPFHTGAELLLRLGDFTHNVRGSKVFVGTIAVLVVYIHVLAGGICLRRLRTGAPLLKTVGETAANLAPFVVLGALLTVGVTQAATYISIAFDDQVRYWSVADALARGQGYPFRYFDEVFSVGEEVYPFWTDDLPVWPVAMLAGFLLFGHTTAGTYAPLILANALLPIVAYLAARNIVKNPILAFGVAVTLTLFPMYQVYSLGTSEPEPIFHLLLLGMVASVPQLDQRKRWLLFGVLAGLAAVTRPEGGIYVAAAFVVLLTMRWRDFGLWLGLAVAALPTAVYGLITWQQTGEPWPLQRKSYFGLDNVPKHWEGFSTVGAGFYSDVLRTTISGFWVIIGVAAVLFLCGLVWLVRQRPQFLFVPLAAGGNVVILWLTEASPSLTNVENPSDFFRHMSHALPYTWLTIGLGVFWIAGLLRIPWRQWALILVFALGSYYSYQVLITPEVTYGSAGILLPGGKHHGLLKADTYLFAHDIFLHPFQLPEIQHEWVDGVLFMQPWDYVAFRDSVFDFYAPFDMHNADVGKPYMMASFYASLFGYLTLALAALGRAQGQEKPKKRWWRSRAASPSASAGP